MGGRVVFSNLERVLLWATWTFWTGNLDSRYSLRENDAASINEQKIGLDHASIQHFKQMILVSYPQKMNRLILMFVHKIQTFIESFKITPQQRF